MSDSDDELAALRAARAAKLGDAGLTVVRGDGRGVDGIRPTRACLLFPPSRPARLPHTHAHTLSYHQTAQRERAAAAAGPPADAGADDDDDDDVDALRAAQLPLSFGAWG